jgi:hypothetical protein
MAKSRDGSTPSTDVAPPASNPGTALALPDDILKDLLKAQQESVSGELALPLIKIAGAGVGFYEFPDEQDAVKEFSAVILGAHGKNVLWTKKMDPNAQADDPEARPACSSPDGKHGTPREGFVHANLGHPADGTELIECAKCVYNKFGSGDVFIADKNKKGKAVTNQKVVYLFLPDRAMPFKLILNTMSIPNYDEYAQRLLRRGLPVQTVLTTFRQVKKEAGSVKYSIATFHEGQPLGREAFDAVMEMYRQYRETIEPRPQLPVLQPATTSARVVDGPTLEEGADVEIGGDGMDVAVEDIPAEERGDTPPF